MHQIAWPSGVESIQVADVDLDIEDATDTDAKKAELEEEEGGADDETPLTVCAAASKVVFRVCASCTLFLAHWFGARRFGWSEDREDEAVCFDRALSDGTVSGMVAAASCSFQVHHTPTQGEGGSFSQSVLSMTSLRSLRGRWRPSHAESQRDHAAVSIVPSDAMMGSLSSWPRCVSEISSQAQGAESAATPRLVAALPDVAAPPLAPTTGHHLTVPKACRSQRVSKCESRPSIDNNNKNNGVHLRNMVSAASTGRCEPATGCVPAKCGGKWAGGTMQFEHVISAAVTGPEQVESLMWQHPPRFVVAQSLLALGLWTVFALASSEDYFLDLPTARAGLDSLLPLKTDAVIHRDCEDLRSEVWRIFTYQFTHLGFSHVFFNSFVAVVTGLPLEGFHGHLRTALIFNVAVVGGAMCHFTVSAHTSSLVGMSGGCYAFLGMHLADLVINWKQSRYRRPKVLLLALLILLDVRGSWQASEPQSGWEETSFSAHLGGYISGLLMGILMGRNLRPKQFERPLRVAALFLSVGLVTASLWRLSTWPPRSPWEGKGWCWIRQANNQSLFGDTDWHCLTCDSQACVAKWSHQKTLVVDIKYCPSLEPVLR